jgi:hypothetical protein
VGPAAGIAPIWDSQFYPSNLRQTGRRWFFIAGLANYGLAMLAFAYVDSVAGLILTR